MKYGKVFFDTCVERRGTRSIKWDGCNKKFGGSTCGHAGQCREYVLNKATACP